MTRKEAEAILSIELEKTRRWNDIFYRHDDTKYIGFLRGFEQGANTLIARLCERGVIL